MMSMNGTLTSPNDAAGVALGMWDAGNEFDVFVCGTRR